MIFCKIGGMRVNLYSYSLCEGFRNREPQRLQCH
jgi:hypothetical protein